MKRYRKGLLIAGISAALGLSIFLLTRPAQNEPAIKEKTVDTSRRQYRQKDTTQGTEEDTYVPEYKSATKYAELDRVLNRLKEETGDDVE